MVYSPETAGAHQKGNPLNAVISLLDAEHENRVVELWEELDTYFQLNRIYVTPHPHFSYQVAAQHEVEQVAGALQDLAREVAPFSVRTSGGLGLFTGKKPVLYIPVVRGPELDRLHRLVLQKFQPLADGVVNHYQPSLWIPHITFGFGDVTAEKAARVVRHLQGRDFAWEIAIDNLAFIHSTPEEGQILKFRTSLAGQGGNEDAGH
jgi:2'-5' RNA ligase